MKFTHVKYTILTIFVFQGDIIYDTSIGYLLSFISYCKLLCGASSIRLLWPDRDAVIEKFGSGTNTYEHPDLAPTFKVD